MHRSKQSMGSIPYRMIRHWELDNNVITIYVYKNPPQLGEETKEISPEFCQPYSFSANYVDDISYLMKEYSGRPKAEKRKAREFLAAEADIIASIKALDRARSLLIIKKLLNIPESLKENAAINKLLNMGLSSAGNRRASRNLSRVETTGAARRASKYISGVQLSKAGGGQRKSNASMFFTEEEGDGSDWVQTMVRIQCVYQRD